MAAESSCPSAMVVHEDIRARLDAISKELLFGRPDLSDKINNEGWTILHCAIFEGREEMVAQILTVAPDMSRQDGVARLVMNTDNENVVLRILEMCPTWMSTKSARKHLVEIFVSKGFRKVLAHFLAVHPGSIDKIRGGGWTLLHTAAFAGHIAVMELLLAVKPALINAVLDDGSTVLHLAAFKGHTAVIEYLVAVNPETVLHRSSSRCNPLLDAVTTDGRTALHMAAFAGQSAVVEQLLTMNPRLIHMASNAGWTTLHFAALERRTAIVEYLLAASPPSIDAVDNEGRTPLHLAVSGGDLGEEVKSVTRALLAAKPELISVKDAEGNSVLHVVAEHCEIPKEVLEELWRLYPEALHTANHTQNTTPLHVAVERVNYKAIEVFQWSCTWEEIERAYAASEESSYSAYEEWFKPVMLKQCEELLEVLLPDVVETVFEYLGFERVKRTERRRMKRKSD